MIVYLGVTTTLGVRPILYSRKSVTRRQINPARPCASAILRVVAGTYGLTPAAMLRRHGGPAFKQAVYLLRRRTNLSLKEVAAMAGVTIGRVAQIQSEIEAHPAADTLAQIVAKL